VAFYFPDMKNLRIQLRRWLPAVFMMGIIFWFSSQPSSHLPNFDWADQIVKKGGHMLGYALLALSYWHALGGKPSNRRPAWLLAILYAATDEYHQSFVTGRYPSAQDVLFFDNLGILIALLFIGRKQTRPDQPGLDRHDLESIDTAQDRPPVPNL
jgi:VanZ family protein